MIALAYAVALLMSAVAVARISVPSLMPPAIVRDALEGWEVPVACA